MENLRWSLVRTKNKFSSAWTYLKQKENFLIRFYNDNSRKFQESRKNQGAIIIILSKLGIYGS